MRRVTATRSIIVAKVIGRSMLCRLLGDDTARCVMRTLILGLTGIARNAHAESIQNTDDKLVCAFVAADDAVVAAARMHQFMGSRPELMWDARQSLGLDIRISTSTVLREGNWLSGETVNWAMNLNTTAKPYRTLVSDTTVQYLSRVHKDQTRLVGRWPAAGLCGMQSVFEYIGYEEDITLAIECQPATKKTEILDIIHGPIIVSMGPAHPVIAIGRSAENDLVLKYPRVSRKHARIENRQGKFVLVDTSANGTFVKIGDLDVICIKHDEIPLIGRGIICPGREASSSSPGAIHFTPR
jgi:adenylate cyclase